MVFATAGSTVLISKHLSSSHNYRVDIGQSVHSAESGAMHRDPGEPRARQALGRHHGGCP